jgi:plastocyanin
MQFRRGLVISVVAGGSFLSAFGGGSATLAGADVHSSHAAKVARVTISNFMFKPMHLVVSPGETVKVTNKDSATHTLSSTKAGQFNTGNITQNQTKSFKAPKKPGKYNYICNIHQYMMGTITVK